VSSPLISIVLPVYNAERWIARALSSTLEAAENVDAEIIVVDDGSTDASARLVEDQIAKSGNSRVLLVREESNRGIVEALNRGLDAARGRFIARMDADDVCIPGRFAHQLAFLEETGIDVCGSWFIEFGQGLPRIVRWPHSEPALKAAMLFQNTICHPTVMARREVFEKYRYREEYRLAEDYDLFARASTDFRMANIPAPLLRYRRHRQQATQAKRDSMERITRRIRLEALRAQGIDPSDTEQEFHHAIRAPISIVRIDDLDGIEAWLLKLTSLYENPEARQIIASQWIRACVRAAPLGRRMWREFRASPLRKIAKAGTGATIDLAALAAMKLDYSSIPFAILRRLGISA
jgi:glycosyltransferase involved in cell wall biosynthesis